MTRFLWWCSGSVPEILKECPTEHGKHAGIGGAVLSTWCLATFAGGYAMYTMTDGSSWRILPAVLGGIIWGLVIFNIDRFLVSSLRKSGERTFRQVLTQELLPASPRILFAIVIALTIAEPLELRLFASEIAARVEANRDQLVAARQNSLRGVAGPQVTEWRRELSQLEAELAASRQRADTLQREYIEESDGRGGSQRVGAGPLTEIKRTEMERAAATFRALSAAQAPRRAELQRRLDESEAQIRTQLTAYRASLGAGYLARRQALTNLYDEQPGVAGAVWGIFLLMVMVEITPLLLEILGSFGPYDARLALAEDSVIAEAHFERKHRISLARHSYRAVWSALDPQMSIRPPSDRPSAVVDPSTG